MQLDSSGAELEEMMEMTGENLASERVTKTETLRSDFSRREAVDINKIEWLPSPQAGVDRRMLDRIGDEVARATSIVRYAPASDFPAHTHGLGEEFLVLEGVFSDEHGDYPVGTYVRNPPGSSHSPRTKGGCTIFVKLRQMRDDDDRRVVIDTAAETWRSVAAGYDRIDLYARPDGSEIVAMERLSPGSAVEPYGSHGGEEILVVDGTLEDGSGSYGPGSWIRSPVGHRHGLSSGQGCTFWVKRGHLSNV